MLGYFVQYFYYKSSAIQEQIWIWFELRSWCLTNTSASLEKGQLASRSTNKEDLEEISQVWNFESSVQAQTPVQSQTPGLDQGRQRPVFTLGPRSNPSPVQPSPKTAFSPVSEIQRSGSLTEVDISFQNNFPPVLTFRGQLPNVLPHHRILNWYKNEIFQRSGSLTFGSGKRNSLFSKPGAISPALGKSSSKSFSKPEISYDRFGCFSYYHDVVMLGQHQCQHHYLSTLSP